MKKLIALACAGVMAMSLAACGGEPAATQPPADTSTTAPVAAATEPPVEPAGFSAAVFYYTYNDAYISSVRSALDNSLTAAGIPFTNYDSANDQATQNNQVDTAISLGASLLVVNLVSAGALDAAQIIIDKASAVNVPVIFFNRALGASGENGAAGEDDALLSANAGNVLFVGTDAPEAGHMQGKMIGDYLIANYDAVDLNGDGKISYAMLKGQEGNAEAIYRTQFAVEDADAILTAAGKPALEYYDPNNSDKYQVDPDGAWSDAWGNNYISADLALYSEESGNMIEIIIANNDGMAVGAIAALNAAGYNTGAADAKVIPVFGVDATDAAKDLISQGKMAGTIKQDAEGMANGIAFFAGNVAAGSALTDGISAYNTSSNAANKVYIPYAVYSGE
ncbi:MAG: substrate-binding domain-containing protein [Clostridiales bacterium]|nr:substrate-binding domain-containing protein [Clostridiales bacterium]